MRSTLLLLTMLACAPTIAADAAKSEGGSRTGFFGVSLTPTELFGAEGAARVAEVFTADETLEWQLYVPPTYDAAKPAGAVIWISGYSRGGPPRAWNDSLRDKNLIWIGAQNAGNEVPVTRRMFLAMFGPMVLQRDYALDATRIYIGGFGGGAKTAMRVASLRPNMFKGGLFISGAQFWGRDEPPLIDTIRALPYVFMSGSMDYSLEEVEDTFRAYRAAGVDKSKLIVIRNHRHKMPDSQNFERAVDFLDGRATHN